MNMRLFLALALLALAACLGSGCKSAGTMDVRDTLAILERGKASGHVTMTTGGSPLTAGMKQTFFLGPENAGFAFDGNIDFGGNEPTPLSDEQPAQ